MTKNNISARGFSLFFLFLSFFSEGKTLKNDYKDETRISVIVIDPGHGGKDPGAVVDKAFEKDIVLDIALKLGGLIESNYPEIKIIYTRDKDVFIPLFERASVANENNADLFISIHANAARSTSVQGAETFVLGQHRSAENLEVAKKENAVILLEDDYSTRYEGFDPNSPESYIMFELVQNEYLEQSVLFASAVQDQLRENANRNDRSVKQSGFVVLRGATMPSVLIETGFLSNVSERGFLLKESGRTKIASSIFTAFSIYKKKIEEKSSFNLVAQNSGSLESIVENKTIEEKKENKKNEEKKIESPAIQEKQNTKVLAAETEKPKNEPKQVLIAKAAPPKEKVIPEKQINTTPKVTQITASKSVKQVNIYFSIQIGAYKRAIDITPANFKGEKNIHKRTFNNLNKYYFGKFSDFDEVVKENNRLQYKFKGAFIVAFENENPIPVKKALEKM